MSDVGANESGPTRLVLVRHGESMVTVNRVIGGPRTCSGLSPLGRRQAEALRDRWIATGEIAADALYSSAYPRAIETAEILAPALGGLDVKLDEGFGEHDPGPDCDGLGFDDFIERYGRPDWESDPHAVTVPGGETVAAFHHRVGVALRATLDRHAGQSLVVVCHGGVVDAVLRLALHAPSTGTFEVYTRNTSITELVQVRSGRWRLERYNDHAHLAAVQAASP
ncbi:MAG: histidine phosphatase family protein [Ilumatobacteraceae bacterium]